MTEGRALAVVTINGNHGRTDDFESFTRGLAASFPSMPDAPLHRLPSESIAHTHVVRSPSGEMLFHLQSSTSQGTQTHDGLEVMATRAAHEVVQWMRDEVLPTLRKTDRASWTVSLSVVGHSLGGLIARYLVTLLLDETGPHATSLVPLYAQREGPRLTLHPLTFMTVCTPHLGSRRTTVNHWIAPVFRFGVATYLAYVAGKTGKELYMLDGPVPELDASGTWTETSPAPLLLQMSHPASKFIATLRKFNVVLVSALRNDISVGYLSSAVASTVPEIADTAAAAAPSPFKVANYSGFRRNHDQPEADAYVAFWKGTLFDKHLAKESTAAVKTPDEDKLSDLSAEDGRKTAVLLRTLQKTFTPATRRVTLDFDFRSPLAQLWTHTAAIGKVEGGRVLNAEAAQVAEDVGVFLARMVILDFVWEAKEMASRAQPL